MPLLASPRTDPSVPHSGTRLLPRVFDGEALVWPGVKDPGLGERLVGYFQDPLPRRSVLLTAAPERTPPQADDMEPEGSECLDVGRHRVVGEVAGDDLLQPVPLFRDRLVQSPPHLLLDLLELCRHAVAAGFPMDPEVAPSRGAADEGETQESEGFRLAEAAPLAVAGRLTAQLHRPGPLRMARAREFLKPVTHHVEEPTGVGLVLKADDDIIRVSHNDHVAGGLSLSPAFSPEVERVVKIDIGK